MILELKCIICKSPEIVYSSISEGIAVFTQQGHIESSKSNIELRSHTFLLREENICNNIQNPKVEITMKSYRFDISIIRAVLKYDIAEKNLCKRLFYNVLGKFVLRNKANFYLSEFKMRVEKWG